MAEYIEREALIKAVEGNPFVTESVKSYVRCTAKAIPAADVRPVVWGEWKGEFRGLVFPVKVCGSCNSESPVGRFCINCGADMRGPLGTPAPIDDAAGAYPKGHERPRPTVADAEAAQFARRVGREEV